MKVGIFDSGMGGLSVLYQAKKLMPDCRFLYYADEKHVPYGEKTAEEIRGYVKEILNFLIEKGVDAVVIACNTATSVSDMEFRSHFPVPIIGMEPAVKKAEELCRDNEKRILVTATPLTISGEKLHGLLMRVDPCKKADLLALPGLVRFAEAEKFDSPEAEAYLKEKTAPFASDRYAAVVLGCTHFNYFKPVFRTIFPESVRLIDGNEGTIRHLMQVLSEKEGKKDLPGTEYYFSGRRVEPSETERFLERLDMVSRIS